MSGRCASCGDGFEVPNLMRSTGMISLTKFVVCSESCSQKLQNSGQKKGKICRLCTFCDSPHILVLTDCRSVYDQCPSRFIDKRTRGKPVSETTSWRCAAENCGESGEVHGLGTSDPLPPVAHSYTCAENISRTQGVRMETIARIGNFGYDAKCPASAARQGCLSRA